MTHALFERHFVPGNQDPAPEWEHTGEMIRTHLGVKPVYRETVRNMKKVPLVINGEVQWLRHPTTGARIVVQQEWVQDEEEPFITRDFVLVDNGSGMTYKNYNFRPDPAEVTRQKLATELSPEKVFERFMQVQNELEELRARIGESDVEPTLDEEEPTLE